MKKTIKRIGLVVGYIFIWLLLVLNLLIIGAAIEQVLNGEMKKWFVFVLVVLLPFLLIYILRNHFKILGRLVVRFFLFIKNIKLTLFSTILLASIILGGFFYASQIIKQRSIERQQALTREEDRKVIEAKAGQEKKEYIAKRKNDCYSLYEKERSKWNNVKSNEYNEEKDVCVIRYKATDQWKGKNCEDILASVDSLKYPSLFNRLYDNYFNCTSNTFTNEF